MARQLTHDDTHLQFKEHSNISHLSPPLESFSEAQQSKRETIEFVTSNFVAASQNEPIERPSVLARSHRALRHQYKHNTATRTKQIASQKPHSLNVAEPLRIELQSDALVIEAAVALVINGIHYAVLMASPKQLDYLALGFLYSEGLIENSQQLIDWQVTALTNEQAIRSYLAGNSIEPTQSHIAKTLSQQLQDYDVYVIELTLNQRCHQKIMAQKRQLAGRTGCGMCGITGLQQALPTFQRYHTSSYHPMLLSQFWLWQGAKKTSLDVIKETVKKAQYTSVVARPTLSDLLQLQAKLYEQQKTHQLTGAVHAAATLIKDELYVFEDVGRHNALDKLIGWKLRHNQPVTCVLMTSRLSIELVQKAIRIQLPWLIGMSAPTSTAVRVANRYGLGLAGFLRDNRVTYYSDGTGRTLF